MQQLKNFNLRRVRHMMSSKKAIAGIATISVLGIFAVVLPTNAVGSLAGPVAIIAGYILQFIVGFLGEMLLNVVAILIWVAQYNDFVNSAPVATGWIIVRDVTNMFFIVVLLIIAFGTMLGVDQYSYRNKVLSKFLIMAIVVNFSRTICGLLIDFAQVIMLTFVNGFKQAAGGNFIEALHIGEMMQLASGGKEIEASDIVIGMIVALVMLGMSLFLIIIMLAVLLVRVIYLWLLVILSPLAFFLKAVPSPAAQKYYAEWWSMFTQQVIVGPILAFFLWLSLVSVATGGLSSGFNKNTSAAADSSGAAVFNAETLQEFAIAFSLLLGGVMMAQRLSPSVGGKIAGAGKSMVKGAVKRGAGRMYGASGIKGALAQRKATIEASHTEKGRRLGGGLARMSGGMKKIAAQAGGKVAPIARLQSTMDNRKAKNLRQQALQMRKDSGGVLNKDQMREHDDLTDKAKALEDKAAGRKGWSTRKGEQLAAQADRQIRRGASETHKAVEQRSKDLPPMSREDMKAIVSGEKQPADSLEYQAVAVKAMQDGILDGNEISTAREKLGGADDKTKQTFEDAVFKKNFLEAEPGKISEDLRQQWVDGGKKLKMEDLTNDDVGKHAETLATSQAAHTYADSMTQPQLAAYNKALTSSKERLSNVPPSESEGNKENRLKKLQQVESAMLRSDFSGDGAKAAFGVKEGGKIDKDSSERMKSSLSGLGGGKVALNVGSEDIIGADGAMTEVGRAMAEAAGSNTQMLSEMAKNANTTAKSETLSALVEAMKQLPDSMEDGASGKGAAESARNSASKMRSLDGYQSYRDVTGKREGAKKQASDEKAAAAQQATKQASDQKAASEKQAATQKADQAQVAQYDVNITANVQNITNLEEQITNVENNLGKVGGGDVMKSGELRASLNGLKEKLSAVKKETDEFKKKRAALKRKGG